MGGVDKCDQYIQFYVYCTDWAAGEDFTSCKASEILTSFKSKILLSSMRCFSNSTENIFPLCNKQQSCMRVWIQILIINPNLKLVFHSVESLWNSWHSCNKYFRHADKTKNTFSTVLTLYLKFVFLCQWWFVVLTIWFICWCHRPGISHLLLYI